MHPLRLALAALVGAAVSVAAAVVLGDYPLTGAVPWVAPVLIPVLIGTAMALVAGRQNRWLWVATGPLGAVAILWGVRIATGWGLDPWPASWWLVTAVALIWPPVWGLLGPDRATAATGTTGDPATTGSGQPQAPTASAADPNASRADRSR